MDMTSSSDSKGTCRISCCSLPADENQDDSFPLTSLRPPLRNSKASKYQSGHDCEFVTAPPSLVQTDCSICLSILRCPHLISCCGQNYCKECIHHVLENSRPCPLCNAQSFTILHNKGLERSLAQLEVRCSNHKKGCTWTGELRHYEEHLNLAPDQENQLVGCKYVQLECAYVCGGWFYRGAIAKHQNEQCPQRPFCCDYCRDYHSVQADVVYRHWPLCKCYPVDCPNHCSPYAIERQNLEEHLLLECPLKLVECEFHSAGCEEMVARQDMEDHLVEFHVQHTSMLATSNQKLQDELAERDEQLARLTTEYKSELSTLKESTEQRMDSLCKENALLKQEIAKLCTAMSELKKELNESLSDQKESLLLQGKEAELAHKALKFEVDSLKSDFEESRLSLFQQCYSIQSYVGVFPVEFMMLHFSRHLREKREWQSPPFYSHLEGYHLCLTVTPKPESEVNGSHVSVCACLMRGEYDDRLKWPFHAEITVQLRNQLTDRHHATGVIRFTDKTPTQFSCRVEGKERADQGWGPKKFIGHSELGYNSVKNRQYLKEDRLCFRVIRVQL